MSINQLANTTFSTGADDKLAVVDVYNEKSTEVVNSIQDIPDTAALDSVLETAAQTDPSSLPEVVKYDDSQICLNDKSALDRVSSLDSTFPSSLRGLSDSVKKGISLGDSLKGVVTGLVGGKSFNIISKGLSDATNISGMINKFTNGGYSVNFSDLGAVSGLVTSLTREGSKLGLPNTFSALAGSIGSKIGLLGVVKNLLPDTMKNGDLNMLADMSTTSIADSVTKFTSDVIPRTISNFTLPVNIEQSKFSSYYTSISTSLSALDSGWKTISRNGSPVLSGLISANNSFGKLIKSKAFSQLFPIPDGIAGNPPVMPQHAEDEKFLALMEKYKVQNVKKEIGNISPIVGYGDIQEI